MKSRILEVSVFCFALALASNAQTPVILSEPQSVTNNYGSAADFSVAATNAATYQWFFQGTNSLSGATNDTLSLDDLSTNQAGSYTVVVTSSNNISVTSAPPAVLTIVPGTIIQWTISTYPGGGSSNFLVQLFNQDKPATVENFIHYITAGAYSNMFFDRDAAGFVLQGGDDATTDRTTNGLNAHVLTPGTNFPSQVDNEFNVGPLIHNEFGTLAMAKLSGKPDSASTAFFFNLADNAANLDNQDGGFTVFGRILYGTNSGSNILQYFSTLYAPANGIVDYSSTNLSFSTLPVNYDGAIEPTDANLFYCDFTFETPPPVDAIPPTVSITFPASNAVFTNVSTVTVEGMAQDNVGLAEVYCVLTALTGVSKGESQTNAALGTTNWSLNLGTIEPGLYQLTAYAQDGAGNLSVPATETFTSSNTLPPIIITPPINLTVLTGSSADFSVTTSNVLGYQWILVGTGPIAGATNSTLVLADVSTNQSGSSYEVVVTAPNGEMVTSAPPAVLTVVTGTLVQITFSGFPNGIPTNVVVQLFDHEKPATVANFLHYIRPVSEFGFFTTTAYDNMVWDRCIPGFILQGGDYDATERTNGNPIQDLESIYSQFTESQFYTPPFAGQVDNEFDAGPLIHNTFGTLAMTKNAGNPDSAANGFFFNLGDNSTNLDNQDGGYTVFGRLLPGSNYLQYSNVLQYFNTLSKPNQGIFDSTTASADQSLANLPVNYNGMGAPANSNLFYADFTLLSAFNADTNPPTVAVTSPTNGQTMTNTDVVIEGTASDNVAVANVACFFASANYGTNVYAIGTTNWTADLGVLPPGEYTNLVFAQDGAGNKSTPATNIFVVRRFPFTASIIGHGTISPVLNPTNSIVGATNVLTAKPGRGAVFANWTSGTNSSLNPKLSIVLQNGMQLTATFISDNERGGVSITYPEANLETSNATFSIKGKLAGNFSPTQITCQVFSATTLDSVTTNMALNASNNIWSTPSLSFPPGYYYVQAIAQAAGGRASIVEEEFAILAPLSVKIYGSGHAFITNGTYLAVGVQYTEGVTPAPGYSFLSWNAGGGAYAAPTFPFVMTPGLTFTLTLVPSSSPGKLTITSPAANSQVTNSAVTFGGNISSVVATQIVCQLFENNAPLTGFMPGTIAGTSWTVPVSNLTMGIYRVVAIATDASGNSAVAAEQFTVNFYPSIAGSYKGLFFNPFDPAAISETSAGYISFRLTAASPIETGEYGAMSGTLAFPGRNYPFSVLLDSSGTTNIQPNGFHGLLSMTFDSTNFSGLMTGFVAQGGAVFPLTAYRTLTKLSAATVPSPGHYVLSLEPLTNGTPTGPPGDSFAAVTVSPSGNLAVAGTMADNSSFSQSTGVFTNGVWPLYASFYKGRGMLIGWETNLPSGECAGTLFWIKSPTNGVYYPDGVDEQFNSAGTNYVRPTPGAPYQIVFGGGSLPSQVTIKFSFSASGAMVPTGTTHQLKGSLGLSTGALKGSIVNPSNGKTLDFSGVLVSPTQGGSGFTLDAHAQTGYFDITPVAAP